MDIELVAGLCRQLLAAIGENPDREGLAGTPMRWAKWWQEFCCWNPGNCDTAFEPVKADQLIIVRGVKVWSLCEHHLLPFHATLAMGYLSAEKVLGLSKFARIAHQAAHRLQLQERLVLDIADQIASLTGSEDVAVIAEGWHTCTEMRGIRTPSSFVTSDIRGKFRANDALRSEFMQLAGIGRPD